MDEKWSTLILIYYLRKQSEYLQIFCFVILGQTCVFTTEYGSWKHTTKFGGVFCDSLKYHRVMIARQQEAEHRKWCSQTFRFP